VDEPEEQTMASELAIDDLLRTEDAILMPASGECCAEGRAERADRYPIFITESLEETVARLVEVIGEHPVAVITDSIVNELHGSRLGNGLRSAGIDPPVAVVPAGEANKSLDQVRRLWDWLAETDLRRHDFVITFGGGVISDLGGFAALGYMRGVHYVNVPTTLVGQVDAGIGGKLAVNHTAAKNLIGGFHQPAAVISDVSFLDTLDTRHVRAGLAETIKKALIASPDYWAFIDANLEPILSGDHDALMTLVVAASAIKAELIARDPYEHDQRRTLGFGHALAHPIETVSRYGPILHGEAVSMGMAVETRMANHVGLLDDETLEDILALLRRAGLPQTADELAAPVTGAALWPVIKKYALSRGGALRWVLLKGIGDTAIADHVPDEILGRALSASGFDIDNAIYRR
jgi:3-dehydroquinate synthase